MRVLRAISLTLIIASQPAIIVAMFLSNPGPEWVADCFAGVSVVVPFVAYCWWFRQFSAALLLSVAGFFVFFPLVFVLLMAFGGHHW